jgi:uncharacterized protein YneF (UPF0154 family)
MPPLLANPMLNQSNPPINKGVVRLIMIAYFLRKEEDKNIEL